MAGRALAPGWMENALGHGRSRCRPCTHQCAGVFGKLVETHVSVAASARSSVAERTETLDARVTAQSAAVADLDGRVAQIDRAVDESTRRGRVTRASA